ncbi:MAG: gliding motility-associated C-terminal domain-containing protein [Bacteroidetes bacterium]|nr:gliding motility-associated C-terminal domain-containing protein [Bacteroidota bacterium]
MKLRQLHFFLLSVIIFLLPFSGYSTHLVGGSLSYTYLGKNTSTGKYEYKITVSMYRDCKSQTQFDTDIDVGLYEDDGSGSLQNKYSLTLSNPKINSIDPQDGGAKCGKKPPACLEEAIYTTTVFVDYTSYGYHIVFQRCCRNNNLNMPRNNGQTYYNFIPPTSTLNSSPYFTNLPVPFVCSKDTVELFNTATDADGDSLVYRAAWPYGGGDSVTPKPTLPSTYTSPSKVVYFSGYSYTKPFGGTGTFKVDAKTGLTKMYIPNQGLYAIAVDVDEYRNGKKLSSTRRDIQIIAISCNPGPKPYKVAGLHSPAQQTAYIVTGGDKLYLELKYLGGDTIWITHSGDLFAKTHSNTPSLPDALGKDSVSSFFEWKTACSDISTIPYTFNVQAKNNSCPPKYINQVFSITVNKFKSSFGISGKDSACTGQLFSYTIKNGGKGSTYTWGCSGGSISFYSQYADSIVVKWTSTTGGSLTVTELAAGGCKGDPFTKTIALFPIPGKPKLSGPTRVCDGIKYKYNYSVSNPTSTSNYVWMIEQGRLLNSGKGLSVDAVWDGIKDTGTIKVVEVNAVGCAGDTDKIVVIKDRPKSDTLLGSPSVCPNAQGIDYWVINNPGAKYYWVITGGGTQASGGNSNTITVNWGNKAKAMVKVIEKTGFGCWGDTLFLPVDVDYQLHTGPIYGDTSACEFAKRSYHVLYTHNSTYSWKIIGGTITSGNGTYKIDVDWDKAGIGVLTCTETAWDSLNNKPCVGSPVALTISLKPLPKVTSITGVKDICQHEVRTYNTASTLVGSTFIWKINNKDTIQNNGNDTIQIIHHSIGNYSISVEEVTADGCVGNPITFDVVVNPAPLPITINGKGKICGGEFKNQHYSLAGGFATSTFLWRVFGGNITTQNKTDILVEWLKPGLDSVIVTEVTDKGCKGKETLLLVNVDSSFIDIKVASTQKINDKINEVSWTVINGQFLKGPYRIMRMREGFGIWEYVNSVGITETYFADKNVSTSSYPYFYTIETTNQCLTTVRATPHKTIRLAATVEDTMAILKWNKYQGWKNGVLKYNVYHSKNEDTALAYLSTLSDTNYSYPTGLYGYKDCFRVAALNADDSSIISWSNKACLEFDPIVYVPNIFTPNNGDDINPTFKIVAANAKTFSLKIFSRWGEELFISDSPTKQWDGKFLGEKCPEGVYMYILYVEGIHKNVYKQGTVHIER